MRSSLSSTPSKLELICSIAARWGQGAATRTVAAGGLAGLDFSMAVKKDRIILAGAGARSWSCPDDPRQGAIRPGIFRRLAGRGRCLLCGGAEKILLFLRVKILTNRPISYNGTGAALGLPPPS